MEGMTHSDWVRIAESPKFAELHSRKFRFLFGWWVLFTVFFFLVPLGAGYLPDLYRLKIVGNINFAYTMAMFQFIGSWALAIHYTRWANSVSDPLTAHVKEELAVHQENAAGTGRPRAHQ